MDFGALPPEINSARMYAGPGAGSLSAAAAAWDNLASELHSAASSYRSVIAGLTTGKWMGPSSLAMASAFGPYVAWTAGAAARAAEAAGQARLAAEIYEAAFAMTVPPPAVLANRVQLATLIATNFFGQNSAAIAATEAQYGEMWAQDATAMYQYAANSAAAAEVTAFNSPPNVTNPVGLAEQASTEVTAVEGSVRSMLTNLVSSVPTSLQSLTSPASAAASGSTVKSALSTAFSNIFTTQTMSNAVSNIIADIPQYASSYFMAGATPLYGMSSILGMASTAQNMANSAVQGVASAAQGAANAASSGAAGLGALGRGVFGSLGSASSLGPLAVPASWTSVIPTAHAATAAALPTAVNGANLPPSLLGGVPRAAAGRGSLGPRYGIVPTVMTRPPSGGYA